MNKFASIRQYGTHRALIGQTTSENAQSVRLPLDAIIVPGTRPAAGLDQAITLARAANCWLLILASERLKGIEAERFLASRSFRKGIVIDFPPTHSHELLTFSALDSVNSELPPECGFYTSDLSAKRNVSLILGKMLGWRRVFFLGDDIRDITSPDLQATINMLGSFSAAGMRVTEFPDNSVVCHANRATGGPQDVFVSGAALAVDCNQDMGFFPDIYHEDWLFFYDAAASRQLADSSLQATQLTYYPFADSKRAAWQEFGDALGEGLYSLLHRDGNAEHATHEYWSHFLQVRRTFLKEILGRSQNADKRVRVEIADSVEAALECSLQIKPEVCARYVQAWRRDLNDWKWRVARIPAISSLGEVLAIDKALAELGLTRIAPQRNHPDSLRVWDNLAAALDGAAAAHGTGADQHRPGPLADADGGIVGRSDEGVPGRPVTIKAASGVQVGNNNVQNNYYGFRARPARLPRRREDWLPSRADGGAPSMPVDYPRRGHAFISYVRENSDEVDALQRTLEAAGIPVWRDTASLWPGENWHAKIRDAITRDALVFIACFSCHSAARRKSYMNEELLLAIDQLRLRQPDDPWLIPVRFDDCRIPDFELGPGRTLTSINRADLFGPSRDQAAARLVVAVQQLLRRPSPRPPEPEGAGAANPVRP